MSDRQSIVFKINYLQPSSIPIQIIDRVATRLPDTIDVHVPVLFGDADGDTAELPIDGCSIDIRRFGYNGYRDLARNASPVFEYLRQADPTIIHTNHLYSSWMYSYKRWNRDTKYLHTIHSEYKHYRLRGKVDFFLTFMLYDWIVHNSKNTAESWQQTYRRLRAPDESIIYNGIDCTLLDDARPADRSEEGVHLMSAGRFVEEKNFSLAVNAVAELIDRGYDITYTLAGDGPQYDDLQNIVAARGIESHVDFTGLLPRSDVYELMWETDIFIMPSLYEGFCNAAVEAMSTDTLLVASEIEPFVSEVIGANGIYFKNENLESLMRTLSQTIDQVATLEETRSALSERARSRFSLSRTAQEYIDVYRNYL